MQFANAVLPSLGNVKIGICVMEPFLPSIRPARSWIVASSEYLYQDIHAWQELPLGKQIPIEAIANLSHAYSLRKYLKE